MLQSGGVFGAEVVGHSMDIGWHDGVVWWMELANLGFYSLSIRHALMYLFFPFESQSMLFL